jgi:hypothetical protein
MTRVARHRFNALICLLAPGHAIYWFASGRLAQASSLWMAFVGFEAVAGLAAAAWFLSRSRGAARERE